MRRGGQGEASSSIVQWVRVKRDEWSEPRASPLAGEERSVRAAHRVRGNRSLDKPAPPRPNPLPRPKSDVSDFGQSRVPNSGKPEFGGRGSPPSSRWHHENFAPFSTLALLAHSAASIFLPPSGCTRETLKRPSAQTTVMPSASTATISPSLPAIPFGSRAGIGLASKIFTVAPLSVVQAPGAGLQPRIRRSICSHGLPQSILALPGPHLPSYDAFASSCLMRGALPAF